MVLVTNSKRMWLIGMAVSLAIFAVLYLTVIQPSTNNANQLVKQGQQELSTGLKQSQQAINQAQNQVNSAAGSGGAAGAAAKSGAATANKALGQASKLTTCVAAAGTDTSKLEACQVKFSSN